VLVALVEALAGGPAIAPVPVAADGSLSAYATRIRTALKAADPDAPLEDEDVLVVVPTSGSTGDPKGVLLTETGMRAASAGVEHLLDGPGDWIVAMPVHGAGGMMMLARSKFAGTRVHLDPSVGGAQTFDPAIFAATVTHAREVAGSQRLYCSLVPTQLQRVVDSGASGLSTLRALDAILVGAAAAPVQLLKSLRDGGIQVHESYGMSETCGGCAFDGVPLPGVRITTDAPDGRDLGRLVVVAPQVAAGYRLRALPELLDGRLLTADVGTVGPDGHVSLVGRIDDIVTVGGANVSLPAVAAIVRTVPGIQDACVVDVPDATWGSRLVAYVITNQHATDGLTERATDAVREQLGRAAVPRAYVVDRTERTLLSDGIPLLPTGKPDRARLRADARLR
jgi:O-succinylbenzoic acid--CoA ligase